MKCNKSYVISIWRILNNIGSHSLIASVRRYLEWNSHQTKGYVNSYCGDTIDVVVDLQ